MIAKAILDRVAFQEQVNLAAGPAVVLHHADELIEGELLASPPFKIARDHIVG